MRNVTVSLDDDLVRKAKVEAAKRDLSLSRFLAELVEREFSDGGAAEHSLAEFISQPPVPLGKPGKRLPTREELYDRPRLR